MHTTNPAATFTATRDELLGGAALLGAAEIARGVCRRADRTLSVLAISHDRMRRIDGWLGAVGFVTHAASLDPTAALIGSVCDRDRAAELVGEIVTSLVGELPASAALHAVELPALDRLSPETLPQRVDWVTIVSAWSSQRPDVAGRRLFAGVGAAFGGGVVGGPVGPSEAPSTLEPIDPAMYESLLIGMIGTASRSVRELLGDG
jgi:hypothetical protein